MKSFIITLLFTIVSASAKTPVEVLADFKKAIAGEDKAAISEFFMHMPELPATAYEQRTERYQAMAKKGWDFEIVDHKINGSVAVVIISDKTPNRRKNLDIDPIFMIKDGETWKLFLKVSSWRGYEQVIPDQLEKLDALKTWYRARKDKIYETTP